MVSGCQKKRCFICNSVPVDFATSSSQRVQSDFQNAAKERLTSKIHLWIPVEFIHVKIIRVRSEGSASLGYGSIIGKGKSTFFTSPLFLKTLKLHHPKTIPKLAPGLLHGDAVGYDVLGPSEDRRVPSPGRR